jgi:RNA polymerase sigma factor (sigma-70 family)
MSSMNTPQPVTASVVDDAAMADSLSRRDGLKIMASALAVPFAPALPVEAGRVDRDEQLVEALRLREATAAERLVATYGDRAYRLAIRSASLDDPAVQTEVRAALVSAIGELPAGYRGVTVLHDVEGLSMAEVADSLGITVATAKSRAYRARLFLRERLAMFMAVQPLPSAIPLKSKTCGSGAPLRHTPVLRAVVSN